MARKTKEETKIQRGDTVDFDLLVGQKAKLYLHGTDINRFQLGSMLFEVVEDESDGHRSSMDEITVIQVAFKTPSNRFLSEVMITKSSDLYILVDKAGHFWVKFGTNNSDSHYPSFVFEWNPKRPPKIEDVMERIKI